MALTQQRLQAVYAKKALREREGDPMGKEEVWTELAKVYKTAEEKPTVFAQYLVQDPSVLHSAIIFVETVDYGNSILPVLAQHTHLYRTYYADDDREHLLDFTKGKIDCLITCHRLSQGIDIRNLKNVILFSAARAKLETIQRIGRCLRIDPQDPTKRARVIDFVRPQDEDAQFPNADTERSEWLAAIAVMRREE